MGRGNGEVSDLPPKSRMKPRQPLPTFESSAQTNSSGTQGDAEGLPRTWKKGRETSQVTPPPVPSYSEQLHPPGPMQGTCECLLGYFVTLSGRSPWNRLWASADSARGEAIFSFSELTRVSTHSGHGDAGDPCRLGPASLGTMTVRNGLAKERRTTAIRRVALCLCRRSLGGVPLAFSLL